MEFKKSEISTKLLLDRMITLVSWAGGADDLIESVAAENPEWAAWLSDHQGQPLAVVPEDLIRAVLARLTITFCLYPREITRWPFGVGVSELAAHGPFVTVTVSEAYEVATGLDLYEALEFGPVPLSVEQQMKARELYPQLAVMPLKGFPDWGK